MPAASVATLSHSNPHIIKSTSSVNFFAAEIVFKVDGFNAALSCSAITRTLILLFPHF